MWYVHTLACGGIGSLKASEMQISWSGCKDSQTSADTVEAGQSTGAMSYVRRRRICVRASHAE